ncbi:hypothetical protein [Pseudonocardia sp. T1-2H]|uniref:hypothetical protein n=1 Tax=Pseudonocardia sp. T1-2H TaxID=3128899 RepID=UPI00310123EC
MTMRFETFDADNSAPLVCTTTEQVELGFDPAGLDGRHVLLIPGPNQAGLAVLGTAEELRAFARRVSAATVML